jgi:hypothetical protein
MTPRAPGHFGRRDTGASRREMQGCHRLFKPMALALLGVGCAASIVVSTMIDAAPARGTVGPTGTINSPVKATATAKRLTPVVGPGASPTFGGCAVFPPTYAFNTQIGSLPVRPESPAVIAKTNNTGGSTRLQFAFWSNPLSGMHPISVPPTQPLVPIVYDQFPQESDPGPFPIPLDAPQEDNTDKHVIVVQEGTCKLYELWLTHRSADGWYAGTGAEWDLSVNGTRPPRWTSADAAGLPILPGLLRFEEVASGRINHALRVTVGVGRRAIVAPATHFVGSDDPLLLPMGARLRLRSDFDTSGFTGQSRVIVEALKAYGLIVADNGPNWMISGVGDSRWDDTDMDQIRNISASDLVYVDSGPVVTP